VLWNSLLGGITPCFSTLSTYSDPPPLTEIVVAPGIRTTSTVANVVYAMQYPIKHTKSGPTTSKKVGIGVGVAAGLLVAFGLLYLFLRRWRRVRRDGGVDGGSGKNSGSNPYPQNPTTGVLP